MRPSASMAFLSPLSIFMMTFVSIALPFIYIDCPGVFQYFHNLAIIFIGQRAGVVQVCFIALMFGEFARYAPSESGHAMDDLYNNTVDAIGKMESTIKKIK